MALTLVDQSFSTCERMLASDMASDASLLPVKERWMYHRFGWHRQTSLLDWANVLYCSLAYARPLQPVSTGGVVIWRNADHQHTAQFYLLSLKVNSWETILYSWLIVSYPTRREALSWCVSTWDRVVALWWWKSCLQLNNPSGGSCKCGSWSGGGGGAENVGTSCLLCLRSFWVVLGSYMLFKGHFDVTSCFWFDTKSADFDW
jgi:hypothetical protein